MNFKKLTTTSNKQVLVNFDNVCDIHPAGSSTGAGSVIQFSVTEFDTPYGLRVKEGINKIKEILDI